MLPLLLALGAGCRARSDESPAPSGQTAAQTAAASAPSFSRDVAPVLDRMCASAKGCHGAEPADSIDLDLRRASSYRQLVNHAAQARIGALRVKPGDPAASFLLAKLLGTLRPREGKQMPIDAVTGVPLIPSPVDAAYVESILKPWIAAGAPNN
jgi:hypothetical protein